VFIVRITVNQ